MSRQPQPGSDNGTWGVVLNDYLSVAHGTDGTLNAGIVTTTSIAANAVTNAKLDTVTQAAITKANSALQTVSKTDVGLGNVDNTADTAKPISTATQTALNLKLATTDLDATTATIVSNTSSSTASAISSKIATATAGSTNVYVLAPSDPDPTTGSAAGLYFRRTT